MALNAHLKQAADMLRRAASDKRHEMDELRRRAADLKNEEAKKINEIKAQRQEVNTLMGANHHDNPLMPDRANLARALNELQNQESSVHREISQQIHAIDDEIKHHINDVNGLESQASDFDMKAGMSSIF